MTSGHAQSTQPAPTPPSAVRRAPQQAGGGGGTPVSGTVLPPAKTSPADVCRDSLGGRRRPSPQTVTPLEQVKATTSPNGDSSPRTSPLSRPGSQLRRDGRSRPRPAPGDRAGAGASQRRPDPRRRSRRHPPSIRPEESQNGGTAEVRQIALPFVFGMKIVLQDGLDERQSPIVGMDSRSASCSSSTGSAPVGTVTVAGPTGPELRGRAPRPTRVGR